MKQKIALFLVTLLTAFIHRAWPQYENVWAFGDKAGIDFNTAVPTPIQTSMEGFGEANASVCNAAGQLQFYTEGSDVWDRNGNLMPNGTMLAPIPGSSDTVTTPSTSQGVLIVPMPGNANKYYIFSLTSFENGNNMGRLYYSVVDMSLNSGLGAVVAGQKGILVDSNLTEKMSATTGNHCNVWLLTTSRASFSFKAYEITASGVSTTPVVSNVGITNSISGLIGCMNISPNGKRIAMASYTFLGTSPYAATVYRFNKADGTVTQPLVILAGAPGGAYGVCFSPDNEKVYVSASIGSIHQFDLSSNDSATIVSSGMILGMATFSHLRLGPNGKIYFCATASTLGAINFPNNPGPASGFTLSALTLLNGTGGGPGLPNVVPVVKSDSVSSFAVVNGKCFSPTLSLHPLNDTTSWDYQWSNGSTLQSITVNTPGIYWVSYHEPPCTIHIDSFEARFPNGVLPSIQTSPSCWNSSNGRAYAYTFSGDTVSYHYTWQNATGDTLSVTDTLNNVPSGYYYLHIATHACDTTLQCSIAQDDSRVSFTADSIACAGSTVLFQNNSPGSFLEYSWHFGNGDTSLLQSPTYTYVQAGSYQVRLIGKGNICTDTLYRSITIDSVLSGIFFTAPDSICTGQAIVFNTVTDPSVVRLSWNFGDGGNGIHLATTSSSVQHAYDQAGIFQVHLLSTFRACPDTSATGTVYVYPMPLVDLGPDSGLCLNGAPVFLQNLRPAPSSGYHQLWNTGDTTTSIKVVHPGTYSLTVSALPLGCSTTEEIIIHKDCYIDIPNAFTPNGDGVNDYFFPRQLLSRKVSRFRMQLFNRWGQVVFETDRTDGRGWDGRFNGMDQPQGVYIYLVDVEIDARQDEHYQGNVTLIR